MQRSRSPCASTLLADLFFFDILMIHVYRKQNRYYGILIIYVRNILIIEIP